MTANGGANSDALVRVATILQRRATTFTPGGVVGVGIYISTGQVRQALLAYVLGPPAVVAGKVLAEWVRLLEPPKSWHRPRRRGS